MALTNRYGVSLTACTYRIPTELDDYLEEYAKSRAWSKTQAIIEVIRAHRGLHDTVNAAIPAVDPRQLALPLAGKRRKVTGSQVRSAAKTARKAKPAKPAKVKPAKGGK